MVNALADSAAIKSSQSDIEGGGDETSERLSRWQKRWNDDMIGWHMNDVHQTLKDHGNLIIPRPEEQVGNSRHGGEGVRIFVPLCGKTVDMKFLATQKGVSEVVGIDGIRKALDEFRNDHPSLEIKEPIECNANSDNFLYMKGNNIILMKGDYFHIGDAEKDTGGKFDAVWDRASIIAIQPTLREKYVKVIQSIVKPGGTILVSTIERRDGTDEGMKAGPPFSIDEKEIRRLYENESWIESVTKIGDESDETSDKFKSQGLTNVVGLTFVIRVKE